MPGQDRPTARKDATVVFIGSAPAEMKPRRP
jgi:hypothetical protein